MIQDNLTLAERQALSYSQWESPDATPDLYFHGFLSSSRELEGDHDLDWVVAACTGSYKALGSQQQGRSHGA